MGYLFGNVGQLAGFFVKQSQSEAPKNKVDKTAFVPFNSIFDSLTDQPNGIREKIYINNERYPHNGNLEFLERTFISEEILKALIVKQGNEINLELSSGEISRYLDDLPLPRFSNKPGMLSFDTGENSGKSDVVYRLSFNTADIINKDYLSVEFTADDGNTEARIVDVSRLIRLISDYPDPVLTEIEIIPEIDDQKELNQLKSSFKFDLRNLFRENENRAGISKSIEGLISLSGNSVSKNIPPDENIESYNKLYNEGSLSRSDTSTTAKTSQHAELEKLNNINSIFPINTNSSISLLGLKNPAPRWDNVFLYGTNNVVSKPLNENEGAGAGEFQFDNSDSPSALSKVPAGSSGASEKTSGDLVKGSLDKSVEYAQFIQDTAARTNAPKIEELPIRYIEQVENIKSAIINAVENGRSTIRMRLYPPDLGTLHIKLQWKAGDLTTEFKVENVKAGEIISAIIPELRENLEEANIKLTNINVVVNGRGREFSSANNPQYQFESSANGQNGYGKSSFENYDDPESETANEKSTGTVNNGSRSSHRGWVDLKV